MALPFVYLALLNGFSIAASTIRARESRLTTLEVVIPPNRHDDLFYNVRNFRIKSLLLPTIYFILSPKDSQANNTMNRSISFSIVKRCH